ncbi:MAG TPA: hypothetical protein ENK04_04900 [Gammaproteobacteria bacterium]|nr:hypothetical protein [Gammaproteobacteria bacterium]
MFIQITDNGNIVFIINWIRPFPAHNQYFATGKMAQHYTGAPDWVQCGEKSVFVGALLNREIAGVFEMIPRAVNGYLSGENASRE